MFDHVAKINSNSERCVYQAYDSGIYFLGKYSGYGVWDSAKMQDAGEVCVYNENGSFSGKLQCDLLVLRHNVAMRCRENSNGLTLNYAGSDKNRSGVVVYIPNTISVIRYDDNADHLQQRFNYTPGYYYMPNNGNLMFQQMTRLEDTHPLVAHAKEINLYGAITTMLDNGEIHSAQETNSSIPGKVGMLTDKGEFSTDSKSYLLNGKFSYPQNVDNYNIYAAPVKAPEQLGSYYLYAGKTMNFMWYRKSDMVIKSGRHLTLSSPQIVLTVGATTDDLNGPASNILDGTQGNSSFNLCSYKETGGFYSLVVMSDMIVKYQGGQYTIAQGKYDLIDKKLNLFSNDARQYFTDRSNAETFSKSRAEEYNSVQKPEQDFAQDIAEPSILSIG